MEKNKQLKSYNSELDLHIMNTISNWIHYVKSMSREKFDKKGWMALLQLPSKDKDIVTAYIKFKHEKLNMYKNEIEKKNIPVDLLLFVKSEIICR